MKKIELHERFIVLVWLPRNLWLYICFEVYFPNIIILFEVLDTSIIKSKFQTL